MLNRIIRTSTSPKKLKTAPVTPLNKAEAGTGSVVQKKLFFKISQYSQWCTSFGVSFNKVAMLFKRDSDTGVSLLIL